MKNRFIEDNGTLLIDGHAWMKMLRVAYYTVAKIREMRIGDEISLFDFLGPPPTRARATITKHRGYCRLSVLWLLNVGKASRRGHIWYWVDFKLERHCLVRMIPNQDKPEGTIAEIREAEYTVRRVCRLVHRLGRMAKQADDRPSWVAMMPMTCPVGALKVRRAAFLDTIAAPSSQTRKAA